MTRRKRAHVAHLRHPLTRKQFAVRGRTANELAALVGHVERMRDELRLSLISPAEVDRRLRRLTHGPTTLERAAISYEATDLAPNTKKSVRAFVQSAAELLGKEIDALDAATLSAWVRSLERRGLKASSVDTRWHMLCAVVKHAQEKRWIASAPWGSWRPTIRGKNAPVEGRESARTVDELRALLEAADTYDDARRKLGKLGDVLAKITAAGLLGLRQGELAGLRWTDLRESDGVVVVARQYDGRPLKAGPRIEVCAIAEVFRVLERFRVELDERELYRPDGPVFPCRVTSTPGRPRAYEKGEILTRRNIRDVVTLAGLPHPSRWSAHSLRDTFVSLEHHARPGDLAATAQRSRHASIKSLLRYLRTRDRGRAVPGFTLDAEGTPLLNPK